jgi:hypothetical protein
LGEENKMKIEINDATLAAALDGDEAATEQITVFAEKKLRPLATELAERFLEGGRRDRPVLLRMTLGDIPVVLQGRPGTLDELVRELVSHLLVNAGAMRRRQAVGDEPRGGARLRLVCPPR